ncbi:MAG: PIN domain-containing protein [Acetobacteraceae bacterium]|nr:PIN domain-containing protein [Acetobacteraceae bacterium]
MSAVAVLDANVLYPAPLRDLLLQLAFSGLFQARWSADIDDEWQRNLLIARPELAEQIALTRAAMHRAMPDALVTGYEARVTDIALPDPDDRHVLAAAITAEANVIVTFNLKDFPPAALAPYGVEAQHPDAFLQSFITETPHLFFQAVLDCLSRLTRPPITADGYLKIMRQIGLAETALALESNRSEWQP